jgi:hypothetical protein
VAQRADCVISLQNKAAAEYVDVPATLYASLPAVVFRAVLGLPKANHLLEWCDTVESESLLTIARDA